MKTERLIAYYRVSSTRQGIQGLGMEAQQAAVRTYLAGGQRELVGEFAEVETGKATDRPELEDAIAACRRTGARLVIARLDRLARNAGFLFKLRDEGLDFVACDVPGADRFSVSIMACVAERERELIAERTKAALAAAKARGVRLGNPRLAEFCQKGADATRERARAFAAKLAPVVAEIQIKGHVTTHLGIAQALNARGFTTPNGKPYTRHAVARLLAAI